MRVLLIGNSETSSSPDEYFGKYVSFIESAVSGSQEDISVEFTLFSDLYIGVGDNTFTIFDTHSQKHLHDFDVLLLRGSKYRQYYDVVKALSVYAVQNTMTVINNYVSVRDSSKLTQAVQFYELGLPVAYSVYATEAVLDEKHPLGIEFPCILKATFGSHGNDNYLVSSLAEVKQIIKTSKDKNFVLQRFVPNDGDFRILIIGDEVAIIHRLAGNDSHLNNTSKGGSAVLCDTDAVPADIIVGAKRLMSSLDMTIAGADVLADKRTGEFFFLEVNAQPQLMTGAYLDMKAKMLRVYLENLAQSSREAEKADSPK